MQTRFFFSKGAIFINFLNIFFDVICPICLSLLFLLYFLPSSGSYFSIYFSGDAGIQTHVQQGSDRESSAFTTRPGGFPVLYLLVLIFYVSFVTLENYFLVH